VRQSLVSACLYSALTAAGLGAQSPARQTSAGEYTRYELLAPAGGSFRILYEVWPTTRGAREFFNPIRKGSDASDESLTDLVTGRPLAFDLVPGTVARAGGLPDADSTGQYIRVRLARPVPATGMARILIDKTYRDTVSYRQDGDQLVFTRSLGIRRNGVLLPAGYELIGCNVPSQVLSEADGRILVSFINSGPDPVSLVLRARRLAR
jgi:hypothetical protein